MCSGANGRRRRCGARRLHHAADRVDQPRDAAPCRHWPAARPCTQSCSGVDVDIALADAHAGRLAGVPDRVLAGRRGACRRCRAPGPASGPGCRCRRVSPRPNLRAIVGDLVRPDRQRASGRSRCRRTWRWRRAGPARRAPRRSARPGRPRPRPCRRRGRSSGSIAVLQRGQRHHGLEGRARRIGGGQRLVEQRLVVVVGQRLVLGRGQARDELVGVEAGRREHAQDVAGAAVHHHRRAAVLAEHLQGAVLDVGVEGQHDLLAGDRLDVAGRDPRAPRGRWRRPRPSGRRACRAGRGRRPSPRPACRCGSRD